MTAAMAGEVPADLDLMTAANHLTRLRWALLALLLSRLEGFVMEGFCTVGYPTSSKIFNLELIPRRRFHPSDESITGYYRYLHNPFCFSDIGQKLLCTQ